MIYKNDLIRIERHDSEIPWVKIFSIAEEKELSDCDEQTKKMLIQAMFECEKLMLEYYKADKINIASFGNYVQKVHIHVQARFENDSYFPESMWGVKQREGNLDLPSFDEFAKILAHKMQKLFN